MSKAKKDLSIHYSSASVDWATPQWLFDELNEQFGPFDLDVCATQHNAKCERYISPDYEDSLKVAWDGEICWMNPPYGTGISSWIKKAFETSQVGSRVVCLLPSRTDTRYFHDYVMKAWRVYFIKGRLKFGDAVNSAPFPSMIVVFDSVYSKGLKGPEFFTYE